MICFPIKVMKSINLIKMRTCKTCNAFEANDNPLTGSCVLFSNSNLVAENSAVFDPREDDKMSYSEVGENFGCIHHELK